ncbi:MAG: hypothetical protein ACE5NW_12645 [Acidiferrobacterales bacterium]
MSCPIAAVPLPVLNEQELAEVWMSSTPVIVRRRNGIHYALNGQALFGVYRPKTAHALLDSLAYTAYSEIVRVIKDEGYVHLLRMWNYFNGINEDEASLERYRRFCVGRYRAFAGSKPKLEVMLPAASVVGTDESGLIVYFLAAREAGRPLENPRQISAFRYPVQYSPRSPLFSRAMLKDWGRRSHLYISGTASIVGHRTCHADNVQEQLSEILCNIQALRQHATRVKGTDFQAKSAQALFKVYVRHAEDFAGICDVLTRELGEGTPILYLRGDLCRRDLLLEIEGVYAC